MNNPIVKYSSPIEAMMNPHNISNRLLLKMCSLPSELGSILLKINLLVRF